MLKEIAEAEFDAEVRNSPGPLVLLFSSPWCGVCARMTPRVEALSGKYPGVRFGKVDIAAAASRASEFQVLGIPAVLFLKDGTETARALGDVSDEELNEKLQGIL